jgi:hypothetical protein
VIGNSPFCFGGKKRFMIICKRTGGGSRELRGAEGGTDLWDFLLKPSRRWFEFIPEHKRRSHGSEDEEIRSDIIQSECGVRNCNVRGDVTVVGSVEDKRDERRDRRDKRDGSTNLRYMSVNAITAPGEVTLVLR